MKKYYILFILLFIFNNIFYANNYIIKYNDSTNLKEVIFYVSTLPISGSSKETQGTKDYPFSNLEQARDAIRIRKKNDNKNFYYRVVILSGNYHMDKSFTLSDTDGGDSLHPLIYEGEKNSKVIFNSGINIPLSNLNKITKDIKGYSLIPDILRNNVYFTDLHKIMSKELYTKDSMEMNSTYGFNYPVEVSLNSKLLTLARFPNTGFLNIDKVIDSFSFTCNNINFKNFENETNPLVSGYLKFGWSFSINQIKLANDKKNSISLKTFPLYGVSSGAPFYISNILSQLDSAGEYYIDYKSALLYFIIPQNVNLNDFNLEITNLDKDMVELNNTQNVIFRNISFSNCRASAFDLKNVKNITLENIDIQNMGHNAINAFGYEIKITNCKIFDIGQKGIQLSGGERINLIYSNNIIYNCKIERVSRIYRTYNPAIEISGVGNIVRNCYIDNLPHLAIRYYGNENLIEKNEIFNVCYETNDASAIYVGRDWASRGNLIRNNYIHDIFSSNKTGYPVNAIYFDDCSSGNTAKSNIINNIAGYGVLMGGGRDNIVVENIISNCGAEIYIDSRGSTLITEEKNDSWNLKEQIEKLNYKSTIWSSKYPELASIFNDGYENSKLPIGSKIVNNVFLFNKQQTIVAVRDAKKYYYISNNSEIQMIPIEGDIKNWLFSDYLLKRFTKSISSIQNIKMGLLK